MTHAFTSIPTGDGPPTLGTSSADREILRCRRPVPRPLAPLPWLRRRHDRCRIHWHDTHSPAREPLDAVSALRAGRCRRRAGSLRGDCVVHVSVVRARLVGARAQRTTRDGDGHRGAGASGGPRLATMLWPYSHNARRSCGWIGSHIRARAVAAWNVCCCFWPLCIVADPLP
jgi:hypothetical protein